MDPVAIDLEETNEAEDRQAEDRIHRIGQSGQVVITYIVAPGTLDDRMMTILDNKRSKIATLAGADAPYGYRKDGVPRKQLPGPGRPGLDGETRAVRRRESKASWLTSHLEYMRDYMRKRRLDKVVKDLKKAQKMIEVFEGGYEAARRAMGRFITVDNFEFERAAARNTLERALKKLKRAGFDIGSLK